MAATRIEKMQEILRNLRSLAPGVEASALISLDGLTIAANLPTEVEEERIAAMSAAMLGLGERASKEFGKGKLNRVLIDSEEGKIILTEAGEDMVLTVITAKNAKLGLVLLEMRRAAKNLEKVMG